MTAGITNRCRTKEPININLLTQNNLIANDQISAETPEFKSINVCGN